MQLLNLRMIGLKINLYLEMLELTKIYCPKVPFIFMSTNKVYGDNQILPLVEKTRWEIKRNHKFYSGIDESMSIDDCTHSFFGASKSYADLIVQEYGKNSVLTQFVLELVA